MKKETLNTEKTEALNIADVNRSFLSELRERAERIALLELNMNEAFSNKYENKMLAIMAGLADAYNAGLNCR